MTDTATAPATTAELRAQDSIWHALRYFNFYRIVITGAFTLFSVGGKMPPNVSAAGVRLFALTAFVYFGLAIAALMVAERRQITYRMQVFGMVVVDILATAVLMHAAGGVTSGIGMLLVVSVAGACLLASGRAAIFFAALASFAFLGETVYGTLYLGYPRANYTQAGLLGAACFGTAFLASALAERARRSEALAAARALDIVHLSRLNEHIVRRMRAGIMVLDREGRVVLVNDATAEILGGETARLTGDLAAVSAALDAAYRHWLVTGDNPDRTITGRGSINALVSFTELGASAPGEPGTLVFLEDAAETRQRAQQLKLASLGRLTASIAHEIRNPLGAISHAGQLLSESPDLTTDDRRLTTIVLEQSRRVNSIIENIMTIGRRQDVLSESFELAQWLEGFIGELNERYALASDEVVVHASSAHVTVRMDKSQLHQVLWNLSENALRYAEVPPRLLFEIGLNSNNGRPFIDIVDSGPGLDERVADRLFEPFSTSEPRGTGLGLYIARELCESNQATLQLLERRAGCRFRITFAPPARSQRLATV